MISRQRLHEAKKHAKRRCLRIYFERMGKVDEESYQHNLVRWRDVTERCDNPNCWGCRSARKWGKGNMRLTNQERRANLRGRED